MRLWSVSFSFCKFRDDLMFKMFCIYSKENVHTGDPNCTRKYIFWLINETLELYQIMWLKYYFPLYLVFMKCPNHVSIFCKLERFCAETI